MATFNFHDFENLNDNQILKIKLKEQDEWKYISRVSKSLMQSFQAGFTPITKINLEIIKDISLHKMGKPDYDNYFEITVEPNEIEQFELVEL